MSSSNNRSSIDLDDEFGNEEIGMENEVLGAALPADADLEDIGFYVKDMVKDFKQEKGRKLFKNLTLVKNLETLIYLYVGNTLWKGEVDKLDVLEEVLKVQLEDVIKRDIILGERTFQNLIFRHLDPPGVWPTGFVDYFESVVKERFEKTAVNMKENGNKGEGNRGHIVAIRNKVVTVGNPAMSETIRSGRTWAMNVKDCLLQISKEHVQNSARSSIVKSKKIPKEQKTARTDEKIAQIEEAYREGRGTIVYENWWLAFVFFGKGQSNKSQRWSIMVNQPAERPPLADYQKAKQIRRLERLIASESLDSEAKQREDESDDVFSSPLGKRTYLADSPLTTVTENPSKSIRIEVSVAESQQELMAKQTAAMEKGNMLTEEAAERQQQKEMVELSKSLIQELKESIIDINDVGNLQRKGITADEAEKMNAEVYNQIEELRNSMLQAQLANCLKYWSAKKN